MDKEKIKKIVIENKYIIIIFILSTTFFLYHHYANIVWDFTSYVSNAKYWAGLSNYYEPFRPPLVSFFIWLFSPLGWTISEYIYIVFVSVLFFYSNTRLANAMKINKLFFYLFSLSPFVLFYGLWGGTELLSLAFLELFLALFLEKKPYAGFSLGLACLARYTFFIFTPLLFLTKDIKKILQNISFFILTFIPWFAYNFYCSGNMFTSILDNYVFNIKNKIGVVYQPIDFIHFNGAITYLWPFLIIGLICVFYSWKSSCINQQLTGFVKNEKINLIMLAILILSFYQYALNPTKIMRFLFSMSLPIAYFSVIGIYKIKQKSKTIFKISITFIILSNVIIFNGLIGGNNFEMRDSYIESINKLHDYGIYACRAYSNVWPIINYLGKTTEPTPYTPNDAINSGGYIILFSSTKEFEWESNRTYQHQYPVVYENEDFIILGDISKCQPERIFNYTYIGSRYEHTLLAGNPINPNPCFQTFSEIEPMERFCNLLNNKGFTVDENRLK
ncbi:MAG: hypothetical protein ABIF08_03130 [Nanoarchaeota archaeon]